MNILFCSEGLSAARDAVIRELPDHTVIYCAPAFIGDVIADVPIDVIIPTRAVIDAPLIEAGAFSLIQQFGVGLEGVDVEAASAAGVWVANVPAAGVGNADSVAEHVLMFMLALSRRLPRMKDDLQARRVSDPAGQALFGKTCCIVGLGDIGVEIARRLKPFHMNVVGVRRRPEQGVPDDAGVSGVYGLNDLEAAISSAEYVVLCAPLTSDTRGLVNERTLSWMKDGSYLINVARGGLVDHDALLRALLSGKLAGAGLDVFWEEPVDPESPLLACNVIATPHVAGLTDSSCAGIALTVAGNIRRVSEGVAPQFCVNVQDVVAPRFTATGDLKV